MTFTDHTLRICPTTNNNFVHFRYRLRTWKETNMRIVGCLNGKSDCFWASKLLVKYYVVLSIILSRSGQANRFGTILLPCSPSMCRTSSAITCCICYARWIVIQKEETAIGISITNSFTFINSGYWKGTSGVGKFIIIRASGSNIFINYSITIYGVRIIWNITTCTSIHWNTKILIIQVLPFFPAPRINWRKRSLVNVVSVDFLVPGSDLKCMVGMH